jgi:hypothetical protein
MVGSLCVLLVLWRTEGRARPTNSASSLNIIKHNFQLQHSTLEDERLLCVVGSEPDDDER